ncbi:MAG: GerMN domain-containing protein [Candidatus Zixiibacteriota bacterium]
MSIPKNLFKYVLVVLVTAVVVYAATYYAVDRKLSPQLTEAKQSAEKLTNELGAVKDSLRSLQIDSEYEWHGGPICLYYVNRIISKEAYELGPCEAGVFPVERRLPATQTPVQDAIRMLIRAELTDKEREAGFMTEFPLPDVTIAEATIEDGVLTLLFNDTRHRTSGGTCRVDALRAQIVKTALQFPWIKGVRLDPDQFQS